MLIHNGFAQGRELSTIIDASGCNVTNLFIENQSQGYTEITINVIES